MRYLAIYSVIYVFLLMWSCWGIDISMSAMSITAGTGIDIVPQNIFGTHDLNVFYHTSLITILISSFAYVSYVIWRFSGLVEMK